MERYFTSAPSGKAWVGVTSKRVLVAVSKTPLNGLEVPLMLFSSSAWLSLQFLENPISMRDFLGGSEAEKLGRTTRCHEASSHT